MRTAGRRTVVALVCAALLSAIAAPAAVSSSSRSRATLASLQAGVLQQLNAVREEHGLVTLRPNPNLTAAAEQHSREMAADGYFRHTSFDGTSFSTRIARWYRPGGYTLWSVGENLLWSSPTVDPTRAVALWMASPMHRANILDPRWREIGVGVVHFAAAGGTYRNQPVTIITTDFGARR